MRFLRIVVVSALYLLVLLVLIYLEFFQLVQPIEDGFSCIAFHFDNPSTTYNILSVVFWGTNIASVIAASVHMGTRAP